MPCNAKLLEEIRRVALLNAIDHKGTAQQGPVIGKLLAEKPELKRRVKEIVDCVAEIVRQVNAMSLKDQRKAVENGSPVAPVKEKVKEEKKLPPLKNVHEFKSILTRFSPNPDAPIHLGNARAIILCHEYAKMYGGKFLVRFEDTDPKLKRPQLEFYKSIAEDLTWLECEPDEYFVQSDRLPIYYDHAEQLLSDGNAYVCTCKSKTFKKLIDSNKACKCRGLPPQEHLRRWHAMLDGGYKEGEAVVRIKTDLSHPNPAVRDWPALRIINTKKYPHPRVGSEYAVWPLYNLACGVDDHLMKITHIIRGKEHLTNQTRQEFMYRHFGWAYPESIHYGRMKITGATLSKSKMLEGMRKRMYESWDDPRLATFAALRRRGIQPDAIKRLIVDVGPKTQDVTLSWENLYAHNRRVVEPKANRYFFVEDPRRIAVRNLSERFVARIPLHPDHPERGFREFHIEPKDSAADFWVTTRDAERIEKGQVIRFMELFNVTIQDVEKGAIVAAYHSQEYKEAKAIRAPLIHWIPSGSSKKCQVIMPNAAVDQGLVEQKCGEVQDGTIVQFERFGFVRIDAVENDLIRAYYCHR